MRTVRTKVFRFDELTRKAQSKAIDKEREDQDYQWIFDDAGESLQAFADIFNITLRNFDFMEMGRSEWTIGIDDNIKALTGHRLAKYIWNTHKRDLFKGKYYGKLVSTFADGSKIPVSPEYPIGQRHVKRYSGCQLSNDGVLTGVCYDHSVLAPLYDFLNKPLETEDFTNVLSDCLYSLAKDVRNEVEANEQDAAIIENFEANGAEFFSNGKRFYA